VKILKTWSMTKKKEIKRSSEILSVKMEIFSEKNVILVGEKFFRPPQTRHQVSATGFGKQEPTNA